MGGYTECVDGFAGEFPCKEATLLSLLDPVALGCGVVPDVQTGDNSTDEYLAGEKALYCSDVWGWTDPESGREFALECQRAQTTFVEVTDPINPVVLGHIPRPGFPNRRSNWCDIKTYKNFAYIVSELPGHGMQVFDLTQLLTIDTPCTPLKETYWYLTQEGAPDLGRSHNIFINEDTGFAYVVGAKDFEEEPICEGGFYILNLEPNPADPQFVGCFSEDGYTHDVQCVIYNGADEEYVGKEICFASNEDSVTIVDVTDKANVTIISKASDNFVERVTHYTHQGWLTADHHYFVFNDEYDEYKFTENHTTTYVANVMDLKSPTNMKFHHNTTSIDHNNYEHEGYFYQANYRTGLRVLEPTDIANAMFETVAFFDIYPEDDLPLFGATWSTYPYFKSNTVIVSGKEQGLFMIDVTSALKKKDPEAEESAFSMDLFSFFLNR